MANLVPLQLDKETGRIFARGGAGGGGSGGSGGTSSGFLFTQTTPIQTWSIAHNEGNTKALVQVYDTLGHLIIPDDVHIQGGNNIEITFASAQAGTGHIIFFE